MIPKGPRLFRDLKLVLEGLLRYKRTLRDKCWTVIIIRAFLEEAMPVLWENMTELQLANCIPKERKIHD